MIDEVPETIIRPARGFPRLNIRELWEYRSLVALLGWRDVLLRYKQTTLGVGWALLQPLLSMVVLTFVFGRIVGFSGSGVPYHLVVLTGLLQWQLFAKVFGMASESVLAAAPVVRKTYFPRLALPLSAAFSGSLDFLVGFVVLLALMIYEGIALRPGLLLILPVTIYVLVLGIGAALWFAAISVRYRDVRHIVPLLMTVGLYASPVGFSLSVIPQNLARLFVLNPMSFPIECSRWLVLGDSFVPDISNLLISLVCTFALVLGGAYFFRWLEPDFADVI